MEINLAVLIVAVTMNGNPVEFKVVDTYIQESMQQCEQTAHHPVVIADMKMVHGETAVLICSREKP